MMPMQFSGLTWAGLGSVVFGWMVLLGGVFLPGLSPLVPIGQTIILTGFGAAVLGAMQSGFGALHNFFDEILRRAADQAEAAAAIPDAPELDPERVVDRGRIGERSYLMYADGSVEVETLLGIRRFPSLREAEAFVGT